MNDTKLIFEVLDKILLTNSKILVIPDVVKRNAGI